MPNWQEFRGPNWKHGCSSINVLQHKTFGFAPMAPIRNIYAYIAIYYISVRHKMWRLLNSSDANDNFAIYTECDLRNINIPSSLTSSGQPCQNPFRSQSCWQLRHSLTLRAGGDINHSVSFNGVNCTNIEYQESVSTLKYPRNHVDQTQT